MKQVKGKNVTSNATEPAKAITVDSIIPATAHVRVDGYSLKFAEATSIEEWKDTGKKLADVSKVSQWLIGDWLNFGTGHFKKDYKAAVEATGLDYGTCRTAASVAKRFPADKRRQSMQARFEHHRILAPIKDDAAVAKILDRVDKDKLSVKAMQDTDEYKAAKPAPKVLTPEQIESQSIAESERMREKAQDLMGWLDKTSKDKVMVKRLAMWPTLLRELRAVKWDHLLALADKENKAASSVDPITTPAQ